MLERENGQVREWVRELKKAAKKKARDSKSKPTSDPSRSLVEMSDEPGTSGLGKSKQGETSGSEHEWSGSGLTWKAKPILCLSQRVR